MDKKQQPQYIGQLPNTIPRPFLDITVVSAEALSISDRPVKKNAFVTARTDSGSASTSADEDGGGYPTWNEKLQLPLPAGGSITVEVQCKTSSGPRMVGMAKIPMSDIVGGYVPAHHTHFLSYRLRQPDGGRNGIINLCVKLVGLESSAVAGVGVGQLGRMMRKDEVGGRGSLARNMGAIAVGIPVGCGYGAV
ncbi:hypothetical protein ACLOJK_006191 [Asimina triloba]